MPALVAGLFLQHVMIGMVNIHLQWEKANVRTHVYKNCRALSVSEQSEANDHVLFGTEVFMYFYMYWYL